MPSGKEFGHFLYVTLGFIIFGYVLSLTISLKQIRDHWPLYRCNPMYMPLAPNIEENFMFCIQGMQSNFMGYILEPLSFIVSTVGSSVSDSLSSMNFVRAMIDKIRNFLSANTGSIYGVFLNIAIEIQKITNGIMDLVGKLVGILMTFMNILDGSVITMQSAWDGPPGQMVQAVGSCFHPETKIKLKDGKIVSMKDVNLGDVLANGSKVRCVMKIDNESNAEDLYVIKNKGVEGSDIYVTGTHHVYDKSKSNFIKVKDYSKCEKTNINLNYFSCLITSNHIIHIGDEVFWDWEDHFIKK